MVRLCILRHIFYTVYIYTHIHTYIYIVGELRFLNIKILRFLGGKTPPLGGAPDGPCHGSLAPDLAEHPKLDGTRMFIPPRHCIYRVLHNIYNYGYMFINKEHIIMDIIIMPYPYYISTIRNPLYIYIYVLSI